MCAEVSQVDLAHFGCLGRRPTTMRLGGTGGNHDGDDVDYLGSNGLFCCFPEMEFFTVILEKSSRLLLPHNFVKMLVGHRPLNMKLRQAGDGLRKLWDVEVVFDADGRMYLGRGWKQFVRAYDLGIRSSKYCDKFYVYGSSDSGSKSSSDSGDNKSSSDDGLAMDVPQLGDRAMPIVVEEYISQPGLGLHRSKRMKMMKEKVKKQE
ncbi:B3 domain-containing protein [Hordeum vulgare]|nr:B3 domain-containing protein [Hordeum vulgare]